MQTFREVDSDDEPEDNSAASIKKRHKREIEKAERENRENTSALLELRDMEDELLTLLRLFDTQTTQVEKMKAIYLGHGLKDLTRNGHKYLDEALARLDEYKSQTNEMIKRVDTTRKDVSDTKPPFNRPQSTLYLTRSVSVRENARNGPTTSPSRRRALEPPSNRARQLTEPLRHDLHHLHSHLPSPVLLHRPLRNEHFRMGRRKRRIPALLVHRGRRLTRLGLHDNRHASRGV